MATVDRRGYSELQIFFILSRTLSMDSRALWVLTVASERLYPKGWGFPQSTGSCILAPDPCTPSSPQRWPCHLAILPEPPKACFFCFHPGWKDLSRDRQGEAIRSPWKEWSAEPGNLGVAEPFRLLGEVSSVKTNWEGSSWPLQSSILARGSEITFTFPFVFD